jgi:hypothetical protein
VEESEISTASEVVSTFSGQSWLGSGEQFTRQTLGENVIEIFGRTWSGVT